MLAEPFPIDVVRNEQRLVTLLRGTFGKRAPKATRRSPCTFGKQACHKTIAGHFRETSAPQDDRGALSGKVYLRKQDD